MEKTDKEIIEERIRSLTLLAIHLELQNDKSNEICKIDLVRAIIKDYDTIMNCFHRYRALEKKEFIQDLKETKENR